MAESSLSEHPSGSPLPELAAAITAGAVRLAAATAAWLRLIVEFDERGGWHGYGIMSCAHWLAWQCGLSPGAAREHVRVARALQSLPLTEAAFAEGRLSYSKVRAMTRIAEPDSEEIPARGGARADRLPGRAHGPAMASGRSARRRPTTPRRP